MALGLICASLKRLKVGLFGLLRINTSIGEDGLPLLDSRKKRDFCTVFLACVRCSLG